MLRWAHGCRFLSARSAGVQVDCAQRRERDRATRRGRVRAEQREHAIGRAARGQLLERGPAVLPRGSGLDATWRLGFSYCSADACVSLDRQQIEKPMETGPSSFTVGFLLKLPPDVNTKSWGGCRGIIHCGAS